MLPPLLAMVSVPVIATVIVTVMSIAIAIATAVERKARAPITRSLIKSPTVKAKAKE